MMNYTVCGSPVGWVDTGGEIPLSLDRLASHRVGPLDPCTLQTSQDGSSADSDIGHTWYRNVVRQAQWSDDHSTELPYDRTGLIQSTCLLAEETTHQRRRSQQRKCCY